MKIKLICEGSTTEDRKAENWGVSFLINKEILFDTFGKAEKLLLNIKKFGIDISKLEKIIISHDDWDHISGLWSILKINNKVQVCICPKTKDEIKQRIKSYGASIIENVEPIQISNNLYTTGQMYAKRDGSALYEQGVIIKTVTNTILLTGCAHPGILEMVEHSNKKLKLNINCIVGGFHLKDKEELEIDNIVVKLMNIGIKKVFPLHCTGKLAEKKFISAWEGSCYHLIEGAEIEV